MTAALPRLPRDFVSTRAALHAVAEQVVAAARYHATEHIGLVPCEGGFGTPPFGDAEVVRVDGVELVHEVEGRSERVALTTLAAAAAFVGVPLGAPPVYPPATTHDPDAPLGIEPEAATALANWFRLAGALLTALRTRHAAADATAPQLWPEHFDIALEIGDSDAGSRANFGASPGDDDIPEPYLYVGPWDPDRRTGVFARYPFGAAMTYDELRVAPDSEVAGGDFYERCARLLFDMPRGLPGSLQPMTQTFTRMDQSTAEQWAVIGRETTDHQPRVAEGLLSMLRSLADITDGFAVDQLTHSLQTATHAERGGADREMVFASLLHDIGKAVSVPNHPEISAAIIKPYVRPEVYEVIRAHQDFQGRHYYGHFGGDPNARDKYEGAPWFDMAAQFADEWDQTAFDPDYDTEPLEHFEPLVRELCARPRSF